MGDIRRSTGTAVAQCSPIAIFAANGAMMIVNEYGSHIWRNAKGEPHREGAPAIVWICGTRLWLINGDLHRVDGPAVEYIDGSRCWCRNGKRHREDGPAIEWAGGTKSWYLDDQQLTEEEFLARTAKRV